MSQMVDNLIAFKILYMLVTPFEDTPAYKLGVIDKNGNPLKKIKDMDMEERDSYSMLHRLVFRLKRILAKVPIINNRLGTLAAAYWLVKESYESKLATNLEEDFVDLLRKLQREELTLVEEELLVEEFLELFEEAPANVAGAGVKTDEPIVRKRNYKKVTVAPTTYTRMSAGGKKTRWGGFAEEAEIYSFAESNPQGVVVLENSETGDFKLINFSVRSSAWDRVTGKA